MTRLFSYLSDRNRSHCGFIPDIVNILIKYNLVDYITDFILEGAFPSKHEWKIIVNKAVIAIQDEEWLQRMNLDSDFQRFRDIHRAVDVAPFLRHANSHIEIKRCYMIIKVMTDIPNSTPGTCTLCSRHFCDLFVHACCNCNATRYIQDTWWDLIMENFDVELFVELNQYDEEQLFVVLIGKPLKYNVKRT